MNNPTKERGAALLVAMIMIFMLSILGISVMRGSTLEKRMATNAIQTSTTFQAAESAAEEVLNDITLIEKATSVPIGQTIKIKTTTSQSNIGLTTAATLTPTGIGLAPGFSAGGVEAIYMTVVGASAIESANSQRNVQQGAFRVKPPPQP